MSVKIPIENAVPIRLRTTRIPNSDNVIKTMQDRMDDFDIEDFYDTGKHYNVKVYEGDGSVVNGKLLADTSKREFVFEYPNGEKIIWDPASENGIGKVEIMDSDSGEMLLEIENPIMLEGHKKRAQSNVAAQAAESSHKPEPISMTPEGAFKGADKPIQKLGSNPQNISEIPNGTLIKVRNLNDNSSYLVRVVDGKATLEKNRCKNFTRS